MKILIFDIKNNIFIHDRETLMEYAGLNFQLGFEDVGIQSDGQPVVFDRCGNFGYLDINRYKPLISFEED